MRLFAKSFLLSSSLMGVALLLSGYLLIASSFESAIGRETERALNQFQFDRFAVQAAMLANPMPAPQRIPIPMLSQLSGEFSGLTAFFDGDRALLYSTLPFSLDASVLAQISDNITVTQFQTIGERTFILVGGRIVQSGQVLYFVLANDISTVTMHRQDMMQRFVVIYFFTLLLSMILSVLATAFIVRPIERMNRIAGKMAQGLYHERIESRSRDEIGELAHNFNHMADAIETKLEELSKNARQKEDFVANVAHELKTPLTSMIGYADMLYQKNLSPDKTKEAAWYILNEGLRLEALSLKLMDLIVLDRQHFILEEVDAVLFFEELVGGLQPLFETHQASHTLHIEPAYLRLDYDLFKTLILNLIDNAVKAGCTHIELRGAVQGERYTIRVTDNGRGMPETELANITEAFYTVDKSRSRRQNGAGIGLALVAKIARIHGSSLHFNSAEGVGTVITLDVAYERGESHD